MARARLTGIAVGLGLALSACGQPGPVGAASTPPPVAAAFRLASLDGGSHALTEYRGKVVVINFWATWCIPCRAEMPDLEHEYRAHRAQGLVVLGVDWKEGADAARQFTQEIGTTYPILLDSDGQVYAAYNVLGLPQTFIVGRDGRLLARRIGISSRDEMEAQIVPRLGS